MRGNTHVRFGERVGETDPPKGRHRASARLYRLVFQLPFHEALHLLELWLNWAWDSGIDAFERLGDTIGNHIDAILITLEHRLSNRMALH